MVCKYTMSNILNLTRVNILAVNYIKYQMFNTLSTQSSGFIYIDCHCGSMVAVHRNFTQIVNIGCLKKIEKDGCIENEEDSKLSRVKLLLKKN